jgi:CDP-diacylglycerol--glycerol-3-phosphate 3-phosphatidyltransferase
MAKFSKEKFETLKAQLLNLPNKITLLRLIAIPLMLILYPIQWKSTHSIAAFIYLIAALTDLLDGHIARRYNQVTTLGKMLDPLADKLLNCSALIILAAYDQLYTFVAVLLVSRELFVNGLRLIAMQYETALNVIEMGKWKTAVQTAGIFCLLMAHPESHKIYKIIGMLAIWSSLALSLYSAFLYFETFRDRVIQPISRGDVE